MWVDRSGKQEATRLRRLATLIEDSEQGRRIAAVTYDAARYKPKGEQRAVHDASPAYDA